MRVIKRTLIIFFSAILLFTITGCGGSNKTSSKEGPVTIRFSVNAYNAEGYTEMIKAANKDLKDKNIQIKMEKINTNAWPEYYQKITAQMAAGQAPDIGEIAESYMPQIIRKGQAIDLTSKVKEIDKEKYYSSAFKNAGVQNGKTFGLPQGLYFMHMYYNKDLFDKNHIPYPSSDWKKAPSFKEIKTNAKKLTSGEGAKKIFGFSAAPNLAFIGSYSVSNGGVNIFNENGNPDLSNKATKEVYNWFDSMVRKDYSMPRPIDQKVMSSFDMFKAGRVAMIVDGTWQHEQVKKIKDFKVGIAAVPAGKEEANSTLFINNFVMWKGTKYEKEAWIALKALMSQKASDGMQEIGKNGMSPNKKTVGEFKDKMVGEQFSEEEKRSYIDALNHGITVPYNEYYEESDQMANQQMDKWLSGKMTPSEYSEYVTNILNKTKGK